MLSWQLTTLFISYNLPNFLLTEINIFTINIWINLQETKRRQEQNNIHSFQLHFTLWGFIALVIFNELSITFNDLIQLKERALSNILGAWYKKMQMQKKICHIEAGRWWKCNSAKIIWMSDYSIRWSEAFINWP